MNVGDVLPEEVTTLQDLMFHNALEKIEGEA